MEEDKEAEMKNITVIKATPEKVVIGTGDLCITFIKNPAKRNSIVIASVSQETQMLVSRKKIPAEAWRTAAAILLEKKEEKMVDVKKHDPDIEISHHPSPAFQESLPFILTSYPN